MEVTLDQDNAIATLTAEITAKLTAENTRKFNDELQIIKDENAKAFQKVVEEWKAEQKPPSAEDIAVLLSQEYQEFEIKLSTKEGVKAFTIRELPQSCERKFLKILKNRLIPKVKELASITADLSDGVFEDKLTSILELFEPALEIMSDIVALILDPYGEDASVNAEWVSRNISSNRMWNIIMAQERANKLRDFFSHVSQASLGGMTTGLSSQR